MKRVATAVVLIPLVLLAVFQAPHWLFSILLGVVALLATHEYLSIVERHGFAPFRKLTLLLASLPFLPIPSGLDRIGKVSIVSYAMGYLLFWSPFVFLIRGLGIKELKSFLPTVTTSLLALPYVVVPLAMLGILRVWGNPLWILFLFVVVWSGDISAFYVGSRWGRRALAPRLSPKKTWEGLISGVIWGMVFGGLFGALWGLSAGPESQLNFGTGALVGLAVSLAGAVGDLGISMIKRQVGAKDSGAAMPGHGGMLDRIDSWLIGGVVGYYVIWLISR